MKCRDFLINMGLFLGSLQMLRSVKVKFELPDIFNEHLDVYDWASIRDQFSLTTSRIHLATLIFVLPFQTYSQDRLPIIDMHLHAHTAGVLSSTDSTWAPLHLNMPETDEDLMHESLAALEIFNIVKAITSGDSQTVAKWRTAAPGKIIPGIKLSDLPEDSAFFAKLRTHLERGDIAVLGELQPQYAGFGPDDSRFEPYFSLAEEFDVPIAIHMGLGPSGGVATCCPEYRVRAGDPLLLEDILARYPEVRIYVMHAGWPMVDHMVALLHSYPQVYVDVGVINWYLPRIEFHSYLKRLVQAGFGKRIMFGSDQMNWPDAIALAIEGIESADFLTENQKRDIFYDNAARFLRLSEEQTAGHYMAGSKP